MHRNLTIMQINDTHGYLEPHPELVWTAQGASYPIMGGFARIAALLRQARKENPRGVLALDNGDNSHGNIYFVFHFTPTSCSWLNAVEGFFAKLSRRRLKRGIFRSVVDLQAAINRANRDRIIAAVK